MLEVEQSRHSFAVLPETSLPMRWVRNSHAVHKRWPLLQSYHRPSMPEEHLQWLGIYSRKEPSGESDTCQIGIGIGDGIGHPQIKCTYC